MKPPVRYARTVDGGNVAYTVAGDGYPLVDIFANRSCNCALEWETPGFAEWYQALARRFAFVRLEPRGATNSDAAPEGRKYREYILDDIDAVVGALRLERFAMTGGGVYSQHLAEYAATRPGAVSHLIFVNPITEPNGILASIDWDEYGRMQKMRAEWAGVDIETLEAQTRLGPTADQAHIEAYARLFRTNSGPKFEQWAATAAERNRELDLAPFIPRITQKTLVASLPVSMEAAKSLAAAIPGAMLIPIASDPTLSLDRELHEATADEFSRFVYGTEAALRATSPSRLDSVALVALTPREREVLSLVAAGHSNAEIAESLVLSPGTVIRHVANIYAKLGIHNRAQAAAFYLGARGEGPAEHLST